MNPTAQRFFAWCGPIFAVIFFAGMLLAGLLPPPSPSDSASEVTSFWNENPDLQRLGLMLCFIAAGFTGAFAAVISQHLKRIGGGDSSYSNLQLIGGACGVIAIIVPIFIFSAAAFRPEGRPDVVMQAINDMAWLPFIANFPPAVMQALAIGFATLGDKRPQPVFPRWVGFYNLWCAFLFVPGGFCIFFKSGPLAWNGILAFWVAAVVFGSWFIVMSVVLMGAIRRQQQEEPGPVLDILS